MAVSIGLHQGDLGKLNAWVNIFICLVVIGLTISAFIILIKRNSNLFRFHFAGDFSPIWERKSLLVIILLGTAIFPLSLAYALLCLLIEYLIVLKTKKLHS